MTQLTYMGVVPECIRKSAHIYRQIFATIAVSLLSLSGGMNMGHTAVLFSQLEKDESFPYDRKFDSWIASFSPLAMMVGSIFAGSMSDWIGRKISQIVLSIPFIIGWIVMGLSSSNTLLLVARFIIGICFGASRTSGMVFIAELTDSKYRAITLICPSLAIHVGNLVSHTVGKYVYWRISCFIFALPNVITLITLLFLKESPLWLINKNKIDEGIESFHLYRGSAADSEEELGLALQECKEKTENLCFTEILNITFSKVFMKTMLTAFLLFCAVQLCGINTIAYYAEYIFQRTFSGNVDAFLLMIATDCFRIIANVAICIFVKFFPQKITLLISCFITSLVLAVTAIYLYLRPTYMLWIPLSCIIIYVITGTALTSISWSFVAEIFPAKLRGFGNGLGSAISYVLLFTSVNLTPRILKNYGEIALYGTFAVVPLVAGFCLSFMLPDTKGRTLQDIEKSLYKKKQIIKMNVIMPSSLDRNQRT